MLLSVSCFPHWGLQKQLLFGLRLPLQALSRHVAASAPTSHPLPSLPLAPGRQDHRAVSTPVNLGAPLLLLFLPGMSFSAGEGAGRRGRGGPVAIRQHASRFTPTAHMALCPVVLQGGDLDDVAGYGRNVRVGAWAGRGWPALPLGG